jgi:glycosyltransferase involved in cell wall biosynthesis
MSSRTEGLGTSILDAMALEIPVVATSAGGIPEIITHGSHGLLAPPEHPQALGEAILQMINNPRSRAFFARRGRERALDFSWEKMAAATEKAYLELANNGD